MRHRLVLAAALVAGCGTADTDAVDDTDTDTDADRQTEAFPRCAGSDPLRRPFFGDTHVHTRLSLDANLQGTRGTPADAYRFARGEALGIQPYDTEDTPLRTLQLDRPLDFAMVSDHAEFLGALDMCTTPGSAAYDHPECVQIRDQPDLAFITINAATAASAGRAAWPQLCGEGGQDCIDAGMDVWTELQQAAEAAYDRTDACTFTSFIGYEWSGGPSTKNLHRNVLFRNEAVPTTAFGYFDADLPRSLWDRLDAECTAEPPCDVLTIPHNSNLSSGIMFETLESGGAPLDAEGARVRQRMEPLVEVFQHKGDSECWPGSPAADELCGFEKLPYNNLAGANLGLRGDPLPRDFVRDTLGEGLRYLETLGVNPYRYGLIASTDTHLATPGASDEEAYPGHGGAGRNNRDTLPAALTDDPWNNPGGLAVLWAEENSREALFRAMRRGEAYGTSGPRILLRFFGGWAYGDDTCAQPDRDQRGYDGGVPMGGDLPPPPSGGAVPRFVLAADADVGTPQRPGAPLERLQVVKGWLSDGGFVVAVYDVAEAEGDAGVDLATCELTGTGADSLCGVWEDPTFDPDVPAFWYVRAVEVPTCRWTRLQCNALEVTCPTDDPDLAACCDEEVPSTLQERAWSSPIWYVPPGL